MNCDMAERASLVFRGLVVEAGRAGRSRGCRLGMATYAQEIHVILLEHAHIGRAVR